MLRFARFMMMGILAMFVDAAIMRVHWVIVDKKSPGFPGVLMQKRGKKKDP